MGAEQYWRIFVQNARSMVEASAPLGWRLARVDVWREADGRTAIRADWAWGDPADERGMTIESRATREGDALASIVDTLRRWSSGPEVMHP